MPETKLGKDEFYSDEETTRRRDKIARRILNTPPNPRKNKPKLKEKASEK